LSFFTAFDVEFSQRALHVCFTALFHILYPQWEARLTDGTFPQAAVSLRHYLSIALSYQSLASSCWQAACQRVEDSCIVVRVYFTVKLLQEKKKKEMSLIDKACI